MFEKFEFVTVFDLLIRYIKEGRIKLDKTRFTGPATYHDPCNYGRRAQKRFGHGYFEEPRWILSQCMDNWIDLYPSEMNQICCGGGGGALGQWLQRGTDFLWPQKSGPDPGYRRRDVGGPCHSCHGQFNMIKKEYEMEDLEVKYLWELVADCMIV